MTPNVRRFIEVVSKTIELKEPVVEIGSFIVRGHEDLANLRELFPGKEYIGCDIRKGPGVDRVEDVEKLTFKKESVGTLIILETLEHVQNCHKAINEIYRVLKKDGVVIMTSLMNFEIHDYPKDYWRFTPKGFEYLLKNFPDKIIGYLGEKDKLDHPVNIFGIGFKAKKKESSEKLLRRLRKKSEYIKGEKPKRHRIVTIYKYLLSVIQETSHSYYLKFYSPKREK